jgi:hypothetical protein
MNLQEIYSLANHSNYFDFEKKVISLLTNKPIEGKSFEKPEINPIEIIAAKKACMHAKSKFGAEYINENLMSVNNCIRDYSKGFLAGFNYENENNKPRKKK